MGAREWFLLVALAAIWGGFFFFAVIGIEEAGPLTVVFVRVALAALALNLAVLLSGRRMPASPLVWRQWLVMGLRNNVVPFALIFWGQTAIGAGLAAILNATTPLLTALVASQFTADEPITANRLAGIALGLAGVVAIVGPAAFSGGGLLPRLAVIGAALSYAFAGVFGRRFRGQPPLLTATGQLTASSFLIAPVAFAVDQPWRGGWPSPGAVAALVALALLCSALAYIMYFELLARAGASNTLLVTMLVPFSATLLGTFLLGERLSPADLAGMLLILPGLMATDGRVFRALRQRPG